MRSNYNTATFRYTVFGIAFGVFFPMIAISFDIVYQEGLSVSFANIAYVHKVNPLHFIIDSAPLFLGLSFGLAGRIQQRVIRLNETLKINSEEIIAKNQRLAEAMEELRTTQKQLIIKEKMSAVGQLTAGIAHEINNPINFVSSNISPLKKDVEDVLYALDRYNKLGGDEAESIRKDLRNLDLDYTVKEIHELLDGINEGARRTAEIVRGLKNFSHSEDIEMREADINESIKTTLILLKHKLQRRIKVETDFHPIPLLKCRHGEINQVLMNILSNASDAISSEGTVSIQTGLETNGVFIRISDTGSGMDEETQRRIFEPFFTTKDIGEGTGLGLHISYKIIENHGGRIQVESGVGKGSTFVIHLPTTKNS